MDGAKPGLGNLWNTWNLKTGIHCCLRKASQGCIRMFNDDIIELYNIVPHGTRVVIANGPFGPVWLRFQTFGTPATEAQM